MGTRRGLRRTGCCSRDGRWHVWCRRTAACQEVWIIGRTGTLQLGTVPVDAPVIKMIVADNPNVNNHVHIVLGIGFYVNFVLAAYFYVQGIRHSRCCRCGRYVPVRRYNIGRILTGQMPLCPDCKLIVGVDFVVNTRKDEEMMAKGDSPRGHSNFSSISFYIRNRKFSIVPVLVL